MRFLDLLGFVQVRAVLYSRSLLQAASGELTGVFRFGGESPCQRALWVGRQTTDDRRRMMALTSVGDAASFEITRGLSDAPGMHPGCTRDAPEWQHPQAVLAWNYRRTLVEEAIGRASAQRKIKNSVPVAASVDAVGNVRSRSGRGMADGGVLTVERRERLLRCQGAATFAVVWQRQS
jgi:hypothetical protein